MIINMPSISSAEAKTGAFTLLELLIVIGIIGSLTAIAVLILNPARYFGQSRDGRRPLRGPKYPQGAFSFIKTTNTNITYFGQPELVLYLPPRSRPLRQRHLHLRRPRPCPFSPLLAISLRFRVTISRKPTASAGFLSTSPASVAGVFANLPIDPVNSATNNQFYAYSVEPSYELSSYLESENTPLIP